MINGQIDIWVILFKIAQYAFVFFIGYLAYCGLIWNIQQMKERKVKSLDNSIEVWERKKKLYQVKEEYKELKNYEPIDPSEYVERYVDVDKEMEKIKTSTIIPSETDIKFVPIDETKEVEILSLNEELEKDPDFLSHSEDSIVNSSTIINKHSSNLDTVDPSNNIEFKNEEENSDQIKPKKKFSFFSLLFD